MIDEKTLKMKIDDRVAPEKMVVGISGELCYVTYYQMKGNKKVLNSETSWTNWSKNASDPLIVENQFSYGFKLAGVNGRWSRNAANADNLLIEHPLIGKSFELSLSRFLEIAGEITIEKGELLEQFIMTNDRNIVTREEYDNIILELNQKELELKKTQEKLKSVKVSSKDQLPGHVYAESKTGKKLLYIGTVSVDEGADTVIKYCYISMEGSPVQRLTVAECTEWTGSGIKFIESKTFPGLVKAYGSIDRFSKKISYSTYTHSCYVTKSPKSLSSLDISNEDLFSEYTDDDWKVIEETYNFRASKNLWNRNFFNTYDSVTCNFKADYLNKH
jgi:hypothetical protein